MKTRNVLLLFALLFWAGMSLAIAQETPVSHFDAAMKLYRESNLEGAAAELKAALVSTPDDPAALNWLGFVLMKQGKPDEAIRYAESMLDGVQDSQIQRFCERALIDAGRSDVDVNHVRTFRNLGQRLGADVFQIAGDQRRRQLLAPRGVDALADDNGRPIRGDGNGLGSAFQNRFHGLCVSSLLFTEA